MSSKKVIVTGGAGYIGSHTFTSLVEQGFQPIIIDDFSNSDESILTGLEAITSIEIPIYRANCANYEELSEVFENESDIQGVVHFAAFKAVGESVKMPEKYYYNNVNSTLNVLRAMVEFDVHQLVFSSSCTVYGEPESLPVTEKSPIQPAMSPYGHTKQICEEIIAQYQRIYPGMKSVLLRYFNPIGAHPSALIGELPIGKPENLVPYITQTAAELREKLTVFGNDYNTKDGTAVRDYLHVMDLARAHVLSLNFLGSMENQDRPEVINLGMGRGFSVKEVIDCFEKVSAVKLNFEYGPRRKGDIEQIYSSCQKAKELLSWECEYSLEEMMAHAWAWQQSL
ncbi:MAG: UDP-glucose 4-epimerase GalE [Vicingaceae bacterium]